MQKFPKFSFYFTSSIRFLTSSYIFLELLWNKLQYLCSSKYTLVKTASAQCIPQLILWGCQYPQVTKNYALNFDYFHDHFTFDWMVLIQMPFKCHLGNNSKERFYNQRPRESKCRRTKPVDKYILITYS